MRRVAPWALLPQAYVLSMLVGCVRGILLQQTGGITKANATDVTNAKKAESLATRRSASDPFEANLTSLAEQGANESSPSSPTSYLQQQGDCKTLILTTYLTEVPDWQHPGEHKQPEPSKLNAFRDSVLGTPGVESVVLHDALPEDFIQQNRHAGKFQFEKVNYTNYDRLLGINDVRFFMFLDWLKLHPEHEVVFTTDLFDVEVLQNPCTLVSQASDRLYVGSEQENQFGCSFLRDRFNQMGGRYRVWYEDLASRDPNALLFNAGIIGGERRNFMDFLEAVTRVLGDPALQARLLQKQVNVNMAAVNYAIRSNETLLSKVFTGHPLHSVFKAYAALPGDIFKHKL